MYELGGRGSDGRFSLSSAWFYPLFCLTSHSAALSFNAGDSDPNIAAELLNSLNTGESRAARASNSETAGLKFSPKVESRRAILSQIFALQILFRRSPRPCNVVIMYHKNVHTFDTKIQNTTSSGRIVKRSKVRIRERVIQKGYSRTVGANVISCLVFFLCFNSIQSNQCAFSCPTIFSDSSDCACGPDLQRHLFACAAPKGPSSSDL
jgi:hypothetical protein